MCLLINVMGYSVLKRGQIFAAALDVIERGMLFSDLVVLLFLIILQNKIWSLDSPIKIFFPDAKRQVTLWFSYYNSLIVGNCRERGRCL